MYIQNCVIPYHECDFVHIKLIHVQCTVYLHVYAYMYMHINDCAYMCTYVHLYDSCAKMKGTANDV